MIYLYKIVFDNGTEKELLSHSRISELDAHAKAFAMLTTQERDSIVMLRLEKQGEL